MPGHRSLGRLLIGLLIVDIVLAWLAIQASFVFLELVWRAVAGRENWRPLVEVHAWQFTWLRVVEGTAWLATAAVVVGWLRGIRTSLVATGRLAAGASVLRPWRLLLHVWHVAVRGADASGVPARLGWWWTLLAAVVGAEMWALVRLLVAGTPLELGRGLMLVVVASALEIALAVLTIFVVVAIQDGLAAPPEAHA
jgi:hypothetical protein